MLFDVRISLVGGPFKFHIQIESRTSLTGSLCPDPVPIAVVPVYLSGTCQSFKFTLGKMGAFNSTDPEMAQRGCRWQINA